jgi:hypothetical protein
MQSKGADLEAPREIDFSIVFSDEDAARQFMNKIESNFSDVSCEPIEDSHGYIWDVTATKFMEPNYANITKAEEFLQREADAFGGKNDGWGCFTS